MPAAADLTRLRSLHIENVATVQLQPLSALQHLTNLRAPRGPASGLKHLPALRSLNVHPRHPSDLRSLSRQTRLTSLTLHTSASLTRLCIGCEADKWCAADYTSGLATLSTLQALTLQSYHCNKMGAASALSACSSLRRLELDFHSCDSECWDSYEDFAACSLARLTQLSSVCLRGMAHEAELEALDLAALPGLHRLVLSKPSPFSGDDGEYPTISVRKLQVVFVEQSWEVIDDFLEDLVAVNRAARNQYRTTFSVLRLSGWPAESASAEQDSSIQSKLSRLLQRGVRIESASAANPGRYQVFRLPAGMAEDESDESSSEEE